MLEYIFFKILSIFNQEHFYYGLSKLEYRAAGLLGFMLWLNLVSVFYFFGYELLEIWDKVVIIFSLVGVIAASMTYFTRSSKLNPIRAKYENETKLQKKKGNIILALYIIISILFFAVLI